MFIGKSLPKGKHSVSSYIHRKAVPVIKGYLGDERLSLTQIAELMDFYFR